MCHTNNENLTLNFYQTTVHTIFIRIEARVFISYERLLTRHLYEPFPYFYIGVYLLYSAEPLRPRHLYEPCFYSDKYGTYIHTYKYTYVHVMVVTWAQGICLICMPKTHRPKGIHIRQITRAHVTSSMYHFTHYSCVGER